MFARHRRLTISLVSLVVLLAALFAAYQLYVNQQIAQAKVRANGAPVVGVTSIAIQNFAFSPPHVQVHVGQTITWTNDDTEKHTVTFDSLHVDSGLMVRGATFSYTFTKVGDFTYRCTLHPAMIAKITVVAAAP